MLRLGVIPVAILLLITGASVGWLLRSAGLSLSSGEALAETEEDVGVDPEEMSVPVTCALARIGDLPVTLAAAGEVGVRVGSRRTISSRAFGRVVEVHVQPNSTVEAGEPLLEFETAPLATAVAAARANAVAARNGLLDFDGAGRASRILELDAAKKRAEAGAALAAARVERLRPLAADGLVAPSTLDEAEQAEREARRSVGIAEQALAAFRKQGGDLQRATLEADATRRRPCSGTPRRSWPRRWSRRRRPARCSRSGSSLATERTPARRCWCS